MKWKIKLSSKARVDIQDALAWTLTNFGQKQTDDYLDLIRIALTEIALNPASLRSRKRPEIYKDAWTFHISRHGRNARHLFLYRVRPGRLVEIGRFLHDSMDLPRHIPEDFDS